MPIKGYDAYAGREGNKGQFLWWCAGAHAPTLSAYPTEYYKYSTLGGVLLATFFLAALSSGYAFYTIFESYPLAIAFGLLWGAIIFNFDRFMVATLRKYGVSGAQQLKMILPRIFLAVMIGITIARPLELRLFEKEVNLKMAANLQQKMDRYNRQQDSLYRTGTAQVAAEREALSGERLSMTDTLLKLRQSYVQEADGTGGSGKRGAAAITRLKQEAYEQAAAQYQQRFTRIDSLVAHHDRFLSSAGDSLQATKAAFAIAAAKNTGFLERNKALSDLSKEEDSVFWANFMISLLIILLETAPVIAKLLLPVGPYDISLAKQELVPMGVLEKEITNAQDALTPKAEMSAV